jgi:L,D-peptidoglycan transpeptidase YkuD (ErfK/YbiS/YcfS/YnhG family)
MELRQLVIFLLWVLAFRNDRISFKSANVEMSPIKINDLWSDDPKDKNYNHKVYSNDYSFSHEKLRRQITYMMPLEF